MSCVYTKQFSNYEGKWVVRVEGTGIIESSSSAVMPFPNYNEAKAEYDKLVAKAQSSDCSGHIELYECTDYYDCYNN